MNKLKKLIDEVNNLPIIGKRTSSRLAISLVENKQEGIKTLENIINELSELELDNKTLTVIDKETVVYNNKPLIISNNNNEIEKLKETLYGLEFNYFNMDIRSISDITRKLNNQDTYKRLNDYIEEIQASEIIFALPPKNETNIIVQVITNEIKNSFNDIKLSKLAVGLSIGSSVEYVDQNTIKEAIVKREKI